MKPVISLPAVFALLFYAVSCDVGYGESEWRDGLDSLYTEKPINPGEDTSGTDEPPVRDTVSIDIDRPQPDWASPFDRKSLFIRFTGTWCSWCPWMDYALRDALLQCPDALVPVSSYDRLSDGGLAWPGDDELESFYDIDSHPVGIFNNMCRFTTQAQEKTTAQVVALCGEAETMLPARTAIYADAVLNSDRLSAKLYVAVREAGEYSLTVYLVEDGVIWRQMGTGVEDYVHDWVIRSSLTDVMGDRLITEAGSALIPEKTLCEALYSVILPRNVQDAENIYLVAFVTRPGGRQIGSVQDVDYTDCGPLVDNVAVCPISM